MPARHRSCSATTVAGLFLAIQTVMRRLALPRRRWSQSSAGCALTNRNGRYFFPCNIRGNAMAGAGMANRRFRFISSGTGQASPLSSCAPCPSARIGRHKPLDGHRVPGLWLSSEGMVSRSMGADPRVGGPGRGPGRGMPSAPGRESSASARGLRPAVHRWRTETPAPRGCRSQRDAAQM